jgi:hypothetical protein
LDDEISRVLLKHEKYLWERSKAHELCELIAKRIERRVHRKVIRQEWKTDIGWSFYSTRNFASAGWRKAKQSLVIDTNKKWADRAGVSGLADATTENGWHGAPSCIWYVQAGDVDKRERVAGYLAQACIARHRSM